MLLYTYVYNTCSALFEGLNLQYNIQKCIFDNLFMHKIKKPEKDYYIIPELHDEGFMEFTPK
ncbi:hypothetical protein T4E_1477 [Trichinella pseudospiralis]|uniref:Uncharacterized protein n=1 Tax=Trichinella pseudospiralis TaxID=6337 RepID=A0A0V0YDQ8_TRIPS|nr:hypothetical protein T4E_1477 [Trichinella pseudospiralis]